MNEKNYEEFIQYIYENIIISHSTSILSFLDRIIPFISSKPNFSLPLPLNNKKIKIPQFTETVEARKYEGCIYIEEIIFELPSSITSIETSAFESCSSLTKIILPPSLEKIKDCAFKGCSSLTQLTIPPSVKTIGPFAFYQCKMLAEIKIPSNIADIGYSAFEKCQSLIHLKIPILKEIKSSTYNNCSSLQEITIPSSVTSIGNSAFRGCSSLQEITIPSSVTSIENSAFEVCSSLQEITIPSSVISIRNDAFDGCSSLKEILIQIKKCVASDDQLLQLISMGNKIQQNNDKVDKFIGVENIKNKQKNKNCSPYFDILQNILKSHGPIEGRKRAILISTGSFCNT